MKKTILCSLIFICFNIYSFAQLGPEITSWIRNTTGATGYNGIPSNVQVVQYDDTNVYVSCSCIPGYSIGPWTGNPNIPVNQNFVFKITRHPVLETGTATAVGLGHIGIWTNGVSVFNVSDAMSYNNQGIWNRNAYYWEYPSFDACLGHPQQQGEYHHHVSPNCLYDQTDSTHHSPIIGFSFDGFPIYGAYAYTNTNGTGAIKRMKSSYVLSSDTLRTNGPAVSSSYPNGCFIEDYTYTAGYGDLDERNGRFSVTPEYPNGTYAYFVTIDSTLAPTFPYTYFGSYYGVVQSGNSGMNSGHNTITGATTVYDGTDGINQVSPEIKYQFLPNPSTDYVHIYFDPSSANNITGDLFDAKGKSVIHIENMQPSIAYSLDLSKLAKGIYILHLQSGKISKTEKIVKD